MEAGMPKSLRWAESLRSMALWFSMAADFMWHLEVSEADGRKQSKESFVLGVLCFLFLCSTARSDWDAGYFIKILWCRIFLTFQDFLIRRPSLPRAFSPMDADVHDGGDYQWCIFDDEDDEDEVDMMLGWKIRMHMLRTFSLQCFPVIISVINCVFEDLFVPLFHFSIKVMDVLLHSYQRDLKQNCEHNHPKFRVKFPKTAITNTWAFLEAMFLTDVSYSSSACFIFPEMEQDACLGWPLVTDVSLIWPWHEAPARKKNCYMLVWEQNICL